MKKLEDIPKKEIFTVPDGYFETLPTIIQARVANKQNESVYRPYFKLAWQYGLPIILLLIGGIFWFNQISTPSQPESILASVQTEDLIAYLNDSELTTEEIIQAGDFDFDDLSDIEEEVYQFNVNDKDSTND